MKDYGDKIGMYGGRTHGKPAKNVRRTGPQTLQTSWHFHHHVEAIEQGGLTGQGGHQHTRTEPGA